MEYKIFVPCETMDVILITFASEIGI